MKKKFLKVALGAPLVARWLRRHTSIAGAQILPRVDPTCCLMQPKKGFVSKKKVLEKSWFKLAKKRWEKKIVCQIHIRAEEKRGMTVSTTDIKGSGRGLSCALGWARSSPPWDGVDRRAGLGAGDRGDSGHAGADRSTKSSHTWASASQHWDRTGREARSPLRSCGYRRAV